VNRIVLSSLAFFCLFTSVNGQVAFIDKRDNRRYQTIDIGQQTWFSENLKFKTEKSLCYKRKGKNCEDFGRLYRYDELDEVCPESYRVPNVEDWNELKSSFESADILALTSKLKMRGAGYQFAKRSFIGKGEAMSIWINQMNQYAEFYHVHLHLLKPMYFKETDYSTHEIFHAHPVEGLKNRKFSIRCMKSKAN